MQSQTASLDDLFQSAVSQGSISPATLQSLNIQDVGQMIQGCLGIAVDAVTASKVFLVSLLVDDSSSIRFAGNTQAMRDGVNSVLDALNAVKNKDGILVSCRYLNGTVLYPFVPLDQAIRLTSSNYDPYGGTPLYDQTAVLAGSVIAKAQEFMLNGVPVTSSSLVVTDGHDEGSVNFRRPEAVEPVIRDLLVQEKHIFAAMGIDDGGTTNFADIFRRMGFRDEWVMTPSKSGQEIRRCFNMFSQSTASASQNATSFSQTAQAGLNP
ncbi:MAG: hypothetical protein HZC02_01090 [Candidatus Levybacteria bacterium]|nr:hypothetical protein [Candidatus Levybacteria bacterium]